MESDNVETYLEMDMCHLHLDIHEHGRKRRSNEVISELVATEVTTDEQVDENVQVRRSHRKRIRPLDGDKIKLSKSKRLTGDGSTRETRNYYLDKRIKRLPPTLETIFEEPKSDSFMSTRKFKRCIHFSDDGLCKDRLKIKKRGMKAKKLCPVNRRKKKLSLEVLIQKLAKIEESDSLVSSQ